MDLSTLNAIRKAKVLKSELQQEFPDLKFSVGDQKWRFHVAKPGGNVVLIISIPPAPWISRSKPYCYTELDVADESILIKFGYDNETTDGLMQREHQTPDALRKELIRILI